MADPEPLHAEERMREIKEQIERLQGGGGGGSFDGMLERVVRLETNLEHVQTGVNELRSEMKDVRERLKGLEVKVDHLPSKGFIVSCLLGLLALIAGIVAFQDQIQALVR